MPVILILRGLRLEDRRFGTRLGSIPRSYLKQPCEVGVGGDDDRPDASPLIYVYGLGFSAFNH